VSFGAGDEFCVVAGEFERRVQILISHPPRAGVVVCVFGAVLEENAQRLGFHFPHDGGVVVAAAKIAEAANEADHSAEPIGTMPRGVEGADAAGRLSAESPIVWVLGEVVVLCDFGNQLVNEEAGVAIAHRVVFEAAVVAVLLIR